MYADEWLGPLGLICSPRVLLGPAMYASPHTTNGPSSAAVRVQRGGGGNGAVWGGGATLSRTRCTCAASRTPTAMASGTFRACAPAGYLSDLGVDAIWVSPFYPSPQHDHGYDVADYLGRPPSWAASRMSTRCCRAHGRGIRVLIDIVPNHCSTEHPWFQAALAGGPGSAERERFHFADGRGKHGELPPNNWCSIFGGSAWRRVTEPDGTDGQWYLHTFAPEQADFNWRHRDVQRHFEQVLRFWFDRGVDGLRIDVAHGLHKRRGLPDHPWALQDELTGDPVNPYAWDQPEVHDVGAGGGPSRQEYTAATGQERVLVGEVGVLDAGQRRLPATGRAAPELLLRPPAHRLGRATRCTTPSSGACTPCPRSARRWRGC